MNSILGQMISKYNAQTLEEEKNALKEVVQEVALCGLSRAGFFKAAAFYGGTALRIFYGLDRFSEDLDFSLVAPDDNFDLKRYFSVLEHEMQAVGLNFSAEEKVKTAESHIKSAFLKGNTKEHIISIYGATANNFLHPSEVIKIKFEVDTNPPAYATFERKYGLMPSPYDVMLYDLPSLFAGKIHAVLCRAWKNRVKGRDLYDYMFYIARNATVNMRHLKARLVDSGAVNADFKMTKDSLIELLDNKFSSIDFEAAKDDVLPYIRDKKSLSLWSKDFFIQITRNLNV